MRREASHRTGHLKDHHLEVEDNQDLLGGIGEGPYMFK